MFWSLFWSLWSLAAQTLLVSRGSPRRRLRGGRGPETSVSCDQQGGSTGCCWTTETASRGVLSRRRRWPWSNWRAVFEMSVVEKCQEDARGKGC